MNVSSVRVNEPGLSVWKFLSKICSVELMFLREGWRGSERRRSADHVKNERVEYESQQAGLERAEVLVEELFNRADDFLESERRSERRENSDHVKNERGENESQRAELERAEVLVKEPLNGADDLESDVVREEVDVEVGGAIRESV